MEHVADLRATLAQPDVKLIVQSYPSEEDGAESGLLERPPLVHAIVMKAPVAVLNALVFSWCLAKPQGKAHLLFAWKLPRLDVMCLVHGAEGPDGLSPLHVAFTTTTGAPASEGREWCLALLKENLSVALPSTPRRSRKSTDVNLPSYITSS